MDALRITEITGRALALPGDDIDTDRILPARFLRAITFEGMEAHVFVDDRAAATRAGHVHPFDEPVNQGASVLLVNRNFGCGSSREHAPQGLRRWGIRAIVGESYSEIFFGNSMMLGLACVTATHADLERLMAALAAHPGAAATVDLKAGTCSLAGLTVPVTMPGPARDALMTGAWDTTGLLKERYEDVNAAAARLPYVAGFR